MVFALAGDSTMTSCIAVRMLSLTYTREGGEAPRGTSRAWRRAPGEEEAETEHQVDHPERQQEGRRAALRVEERDRHAEHQLFEHRHRHQRAIARRIAADDPEDELEHAGGADEAVSDRLGARRRGLEILREQDGEPVNRRAAIPT